jgi:protein tyrosine phosphatase
MLQQIKNTNIFIGNKDDEKLIDKKKLVIVHACQSYFDKVKVNKYFGNNSNIKESKGELYINWVDLPDSNNFDLNTFNNILHWMKEKYSENKNLFVHCDWGQSRSPTLVMVFMVKILRILPDNFFEALEKFKILYPDYITPTGISRFVKENWNNIEPTSPTPTPSTSQR